MKGGEFRCCFNSILWQAVPWGERPPFPDDVSLAPQIVDLTVQAPRTFLPILLPAGQTPATPAVSLGMGVVRNANWDASNSSNLMEQN